MLLIARAEAVSGESGNQDASRSRTTRKAGPAVAPAQPCRVGGGELEVYVRYREVWDWENAVDADLVRRERLTLDRTQ